jgi:flagellar motor switch protein FliM
MTRASSSLAADEVAALMSEIGDLSFSEAQDESAPAPLAARPAPHSKTAASPFTLGGAKDRPTINLSLIERMNERLARRLRDVIEPIAQARARVEAKALEICTFDEWQRRQPDYMSLTLYRVRPGKGMMMIAVEPAFVANMVDAFYGGTTGGVSVKDGEFTPAEDRLLTRLVGGISDVLRRTWGDFYPLDMQRSTHETNPIFASMMRGDEPVVVQRIAIKPRSTRQTHVEILYPLALLQPIEEELATRVHGDSEDDGDLEWRGKLAGALDNVTLPVRSVLARPEITVAQLMALKAGDVIPIKLSSTVPLLVGNRRFAEGTIGEQEGRAAMMIESIGKDFFK